MPNTLNEDGEIADKLVEISELVDDEPNAVYRTFEMNELVQLISTHTASKVKQTENHARNVLHTVLSEDVDHALDYSDIEEIFVAQLSPRKEEDRT